MPRDLQTFPEPQTLRAPDDLARREPTLREFLAFCRSKPAGEEYAFFDVDRCAVMQFLDARGLSRDLYFKMSVLTGSAACMSPYTFGALSDRLASRLEALSARAGEEVAR